MRLCKLRSTVVIGFTIGILATAIAAGLSNGAPRSDMAASLTTYREQWKKFELFLGRVYGQNWSTARLSDKAAAIVSWHNDADTKLRAAEAEIADATKSLDSESSSIRLDQALLITPRARWQ